MKLDCTRFAGRGTTEGGTLWNSQVGGQIRSAREFLAALLKDEVASSRLLEAIGFGKVRTHLFRTEVVLQSG
jgi:hypothetical protein